MTETQIIKETKEETNEREGTTEKFTETQRETQETKEGTPETREVQQEKVNEIRGNKDKEHTHVELVGDNEVELVECFVTWCEQ